MFKNMILVILFDMLLNPSFKMTTSFTNITRTTASTSKFIYSERFQIIRNWVVIWKKKKKFEWTKNKKNKSLMLIFFYKTLLKFLFWYGVNVLMFSISLWKEFQLLQILNDLSIRHLIKLILYESDVKLLKFKRNPL